MATARVKGLRTALVVVALATAAWLGYETAHAGSDIAPQAPGQLTRLAGGSASDKRVDGKSWSLDYDSATMSPDNASAEIENIRDGVINRDGKPYMHVRAKHVTANLALNDFTVTGPVVFTEIGGQHRTLVTNGAHYVGYTHTLTLANRTTIRSGGLHLTVDRATVDFSSGKTSLGRIVGTM